MNYLRKKTQSIYSVFIRLILIIIIFGYYSCSFQTGHWEQFRAQGLRKKFEHFNHMVFVNDRVGFLCGFYISEKEAQENESLTQHDALIYKTTDGGRTWNKKNLQKGSIENIEAENDTIYALKRIFTENNFNNLSSAILKSNDKGETWKEIYRSELPFHIMKLLFSDSQNGIAIFQNQEKRSEVSVKQTSDGGKSWSLKANVSDFADLINILLIGNKLYYFSLRPSSQVKGVLTVLDLQTGHLTKENLPGNIDARIIAEDNHGNIWIAGKIDDSLVILSRNSNGTISEIPLLSSLRNLSPYSIHISERSIKLFAAKKGTILGVTKRFFSSTNLGKTWNDEKLPSSLYVKPIAYYGEDIVWTYCGGGKIQRRGI